ncbi:MAG: hypothetical protein HKO82_14880 [Acidimicrobiia bacterium]|nr:hypothetical protein [Acidimicrobiia bacterium]
MRLLPRGYAPTIELVEHLLAWAGDESVRLATQHDKRRATEETRKGIRYQLGPLEGVVYGLCEILDEMKNHPEKTATEWAELYQVPEDEPELWHLLAMEEYRPGR